MKRDSQSFRLRAAANDKFRRYFYAFVSEQRVQIISQSRGKDLWHHQVDLQSGEVSEAALPALQEELSRDGMSVASLAVSPQGQLTIGATGISILHRTARQPYEFRCASYVIDPHTDHLIRAWPQLGGALFWESDRKLYALAKHGISSGPTIGEAFDMVLVSNGSLPDLAQLHADGAFMETLLQAHPQRVNGMRYPGYVEDHDEIAFGLQHGDFLRSSGVELLPTTAGLQNIDAMQVLANGELLLSLGSWHKGSTLERYHLIANGEGRPLTLLEGARERDSQVVALMDENILYLGPSGMALYDRNGLRIAEVPLAPTTISTLTGLRYRIEAVASDGRLLFAGTTYAPAAARDSFFVFLPESNDPGDLARHIDARVAAHKKLLREP